MSKSPHAVKPKPGRGEWGMDSVSTASGVCFSSPSVISGTPTAFAVRQPQPSFRHEHQPPQQQCEPDHHYFGPQVTPEQKLESRPLRDEAGGAILELHVLENKPRWNLRYGQGKLCCEMQGNARTSEMMSRKIYRHRQK